MAQSLPQVPASQGQFFLSAVALAVDLQAQALVHPLQVHVPGAQVHVPLAELAQLQAILVQ